MNTIVVEKTVSDDIDNAFHIRAGYAVLGWGRLLDLSGDYYPALLEEFYANLKEKSRKFSPELKSWVKGVEITISAPLINEMFGLPVVGEPLHLTQDLVTSDLAWKSYEAAQRFNVNWIPSPFRSK